jgi:hypothetical protein
MALRWTDKDPDEQLDFSVDWSRYLGGDTIDSVVWKIKDSDGSLNTWVDAEVVQGLQRISASNNNTVATIEMGLGTAGKDYSINCVITTAAGLTVSREIRLKVRQQ